MPKIISAEDYEKALLETLMLKFRPPFFDVRGTRNGQKYYITGVMSGKSRQIDAAVYREGEPNPILVADAKNRGRPLDVTAVDSFVGFLQDVGCRVGLLVGPREPTSTVPEYAKNCGIDVYVMTEEEARTARWLDLCRLLIPYDWAFRRDMALALEYISSGQSSEKVLDALADVPFDEWDAFVEYGLHAHPREAHDFLLFQVLNHYDFDWRAGALNRLFEAGLLTAREAWGFERDFRGFYGYYDVMQHIDPEGLDHPDRSMSGQ